MKEIRLTVRKRAFPSQGRVRLNVAHVPDLEIHEGDHVDLVNEVTQKTVTATVIVDTMVPQGQVRVSEEDLRTLGLLDNDGVLVRKTPPLQDRIKKAAEDASTSLSRGVDTLDEKVKKTAQDVKAGTAKAADTVKKETRKASATVEKTAAKTVKDVKNAVKKATGRQDKK